MKYLSMTRKIKVLLPAIIFGVSIIFFVWVTATRPLSKPSPSKERVWIVEVITAQPKMLAPALTLYGKVETPHLTKAVSPNKGRVQSLLVKEGERVSTGQLLLALDERDFKLRLVQTEARVNELTAEIENEKIKFKNDQKALNYELSLLKLAKVAVERLRQLKTKNLGSDAAIDQAQENVERQKIAVNSRRLALNGYQSRVSSLQAKLQGTQADHDLATLDWDRSRIISPYEGYVASVDVTEGDQVVANQLLLTVYPTKSLEVKAMVPAPYQEEIQSAIAENSHLEASAKIGSTEIQLILDRVAAQADARGIDGIFYFTNHNDSIRIGRLIEITLYRPAHKDSVVVPRQALYGRNRIYKIVNNRLTALPVEIIGEYRHPSDTPGLLISSSSIKAGDLIVTNHLPNAVEGMLVTVSDQPKAVIEK